MPPKKTQNNEPDPPEPHSNLTADGPNTRCNTRRQTSDEIEAMLNKVMDTRDAENYLQEKLLNDQWHTPTSNNGNPSRGIHHEETHRCEIAEAAATHFTNIISARLTDQITTATSPQVTQIQSASNALESATLESENLCKNLQHEREEKEEDIKTAAERIKEATNTLHESVDECKAILKTLRPALETTKESVTQLSTQLSTPKPPPTNQSQESGTTQPTYSSVAAANLPPAVDQAMAQAATRARQVLITPKTGNSIFPDTNQHADIVKLIKQALADSKSEDTPEGNVRSVLTLNSGAIIIEFDTEELATWLRSPAGCHTFEECLGPAASLRECTFGIVLQYLPIMLKIDHEDFLHQCKEENTLPAHSLHSIRWIKPPQRHSKEQ
ncbi:hypothetical protein EV702DRAFT_1048108 [Suillus placidus]|uniref:Uncharacterized protein n=1 Tax=Suillus placidus TaxID=48579 RepID=A0A9P6ZP58_9AGAM|nr:hypothetical protein EV702DRAFT_1048108 [Suillus placidus]